MSGGKKSAKHSAIVSLRKAPYKRGLVHLFLHADQSLLCPIAKTLALLLEFFCDASVLGHIYEGASLPQLVDDENEIRDIVFKSQLIEHLQVLPGRDIETDGDLFEYCRLGEIQEIESIDCPNLRHEHFFRSQIFYIVKISASSS